MTYLRARAVIAAARRSASPRARPPRSDLAKGVKLSFTGVGLSLFFLFFEEHLWPIGLIVLFVGLGHLAAHALTGRKQPDAPTAG